MAFVIAYKLKLTLSSLPVQHPHASHFAGLTKNKHESIPMLKNEKYVYMC